MLTATKTRALMKSPKNPRSANRRRPGFSPPAMPVRANQPVDASASDAKGLSPEPGWNAARRLVLVSGLSFLAACGFTPVYGPGGAGEGLQGSILVAEPDTRNAFVFVARLEDRLGQPQNAPYLLAYDIDTRSEGVGITPAQETTRYNLFGTVTYTITDRATETVVFQGREKNFTGYSATSLIVGTQSVTRDANERLMTALADQIVTRLIATSKDWRQ